VLRALSAPYCYSRRRPGEPGEPNWSRNGCTRCNCAKCYGAAFSWYALMKRPRNQS